MSKQDHWDGFKMLVFILAAMLFLVALFYHEVSADELAESIVLDAELESGDFILGSVGEDTINIQKQGETTTGYIGDDTVYLHEIEIGGWKMTTGTVGEESINVQVWGEDDD